MYLIGQFGLLFFIICIFILLLIAKRITFRKDYLFIIVFFLSIIYLFLFPIYDQVIDEFLNKKLYLQISILIFVFFYIPFLLLYGLRNKIGNLKKTGNLTPVNYKESLYASFCLFFAIGFYVISIPNSLFYVRDSVYDPELKGNLNFFQFLIYKSYIDYSPIIILLSTYLLVKFRNNHYKLFFKFSYFIYLFSFLIFLIINSRLGFLIFCIQIAGVLFIFNIIKRYSAKTYLYFLVGFIFILYGYNVVLNIRSNISTEGFQLSYFNPVNFEISEGSSETINSRLDGIYLMAEMTPAAKKIGFANGKAWGIPLFLSIAPVFFPQQAQALKSSYMTDSESYLLLTYTDLANSTMDFNSVLLTDMYCNFSFWGFLLAAFFVVYILLYTKRNILLPKSKFSLILAFFFFSKIMVFESESISILLKLFKFLPFFFTLWWLIPVKFIKTVYDDNNNNSNIQ